MRAKILLLLALLVLAQVGCTVASPPREVVVSDPPASRADDLVRQVQMALVHLGYLPASDIDGRPGPRTRAALVRFQTINGSPETSISPKLLERLNSRQAVRAPDPVPASPPAHTWLRLADQTPTLLVYPIHNDPGPGWVAPVPGAAPIAEGVLIEPVIEDTATLLASERRFVLVGVEGLEEPYVSQLRHYLAQHGGQLRCFPEAQDRAVCVTTDDGVDLGSVLLVNGAATITPDASDAYEAQQTDAIEHHRGLWRLLASASW